jgi:flagellar hook assembly protein FlgD
VYAANGQLVATLMDGPVTRGEHRVEWNGRDNAGTPVSSGVYFYRLRMGDFVSQKKMVLLK